VAAVITAALVAINRFGVQQPLVYVAFGVVLWVAVLQSGVHATIAGVVLAMTIPASAPRSAGAHATRPADDGANGADEEHSPLHTLEHLLLPWVAFFIMPVFALANAGVALTGGLAATLAHPIGLGIIVGLLVGKPVGILLASWLAVRSGLAALPVGITWLHILGVGFLGGIGFTMSLFIAGLALGDSALLDIAKIGILGGSLLSGLVGFGLLFRMRPMSSTDDAVASASLADRVDEEVVVAR
jgi:Na+:H+ antiporter, NhaA family